MYSSYYLIFDMPFYLPFVFVSIGVEIGSCFRRNIRVILTVSCVSLFADEKYWAGYYPQGGATLVDQSHNTAINTAAVLSANVAVGCVFRLGHRRGFRSRGIVYMWNVSVRRASPSTTSD